MSDAEKDIVERLGASGFLDGESWLEFEARRALDRTDAMSAITTLRAEVERLTKAVEEMDQEWCDSENEAIQLEADFQKADARADKAEAERDAAIARAEKAEAALAKMREAALEAVICAEADCLTKDAPATHRLRASLTEGE